MEGALRALDRSLFAALFRECHRTVRDSEEARDLVQEAFIKVWRRCATFRGESELTPWVRSILRHGILDRLKRRETNVPMEDDGRMTREVEAALAAAAAGPPAAEAEIGRGELDTCFARCWARFEAAAPVHATVLTWVVEDGLSHEQIAQLLGRTPGATREFISQCRKRARLHLAEWYALATAPGAST